ncbi:MAG: VWA domain-containing protein [Planctomycetota bacterium]|nr:MAG: VWA domain-containing protein [Planctomycetota bacterium]
MTFGALAAATGGEVTRLRWLAALPAWASFLIVLGFVVWAVAIYRRERTSRGPWARGLLAALRVGALVALLLMWYRPVQTTTREQPRPSYAAILLDRSVSMSLRDHLGDPEQRKRLAAAIGLETEALDELPRLELVRRAVARHGGQLVRRLLEHNRVRIYSFAERPTLLAELAPEQAGSERRSDGEKQPTDDPVASALERIEALKADGGETALGDALARVAAELRGKNVAGIVLFSDGRSNAGAVSPREAARRLGRSGIPVYTVGVGNPEPPVDVALANLEAAPVVRAGDVLRIGLELRVRALPPEVHELALEVRLDDELVHTETVDLDALEDAETEPGERTLQLTLRVRPEEVGEHTLSVTAPPLTGEVIHDNNRLQQRLRVIDKRIKVLYVENLPRYEYRFLRWALVRDKNMEAQIFQLSADPEFVQDSSPGVPPLDHVPATRKELFAYHVIILGDVDPYDPQLGKPWLELLKEFVEDYGGGLLVISGRMYMPRAYGGSPVASLLPVRIDPADDGLRTLGSVIRESFHPKLTIDGRRSPLLRLEDDPEANRELWEGGRLPGFYWYYKPRETKPGAEVLAVHPEDRTEKGQPVPIFALQHAGAGTVFYSATDDVWRWRAGVGDRYSYRLWGQAIRYLAAARLTSSQRFSLTTDRSVYDLGDRVMLHAEIRDRDLKPSEQEQAFVFVERPDGEVQRIVMERETGQPGRFRAEFPAVQVGAYRAWLGSEDRGAGGEPLVVRTFSVQVPELEKADPRMDRALLEAVARASDGAYVALADAATLPDAVGSVREVVEVRLAQNERWDDSWVLLVVVGLLSLEWALRRRWEML